MKKIILVPVLAALVLASCGGASHPLVGNKFAFTTKSPVNTYAAGYDETSYFALIGHVNSNLNTFAKLDAHFRSSLPNDFLEISSDAYNGGYFTYAAADHVTIYATVYPLDNKGIDTAKVSVSDTSKAPHIVASGASKVGSINIEFEVDFSTFEKVDDTHSNATLTSTYYPNADDKTNSIVATFVYEFQVSK